MSKGNLPKIEFFYDLSSPWTRIAFHNIQKVVAEAGADIRWRPLLVGGVFNAVNREVYARRQAVDDPKAKHSFKWLREWATLAGVPMNFPSKFHPLRSVLAMRACCVLEDEQQTLFKFSCAAFDAYYRDVRNLDDPDVLAEVAFSSGLDGEQLVREAGRQIAKDRLRANTEEAIGRGAYGSPTMFVGGDRLYFGNDQLPLVRQALRKLSDQGARV